LSLKAFFGVGRFGKVSDGDSSLVFGLSIFSSTITLKTHSNSCPGALSLALISISSPIFALSFGLISNLIVPSVGPSLLIVNISVTSSGKGLGLGLTDLSVLFLFWRICISNSPFSAGLNK
jgi:hypothetical protein